MHTKLFLAAVLLVGSFVQSAAQEAGPCVIRSIEGRASVSAPGTVRQVATVRLGLGSNAILRTGANAHVTLSCPDALRVVVGPNTEIAVAKLLSSDTQPVALRLMQGIAGFLFNGVGDGVQVHTPSAVAAVRSTQWAMRVENGASAVFAREGTVFVVGGDATVQLGAGDGVDVSGRGEVGPVVRWGQARIELFARLLGPDW